MAELKKKITDRLNQLYSVALDKHERDIIKTILNSNNFGEVIENKRPESIKEIGIIIFSVRKYAGGTTSILRLATGLANLGYSITYINYGEQRIRELEDNAKFNLKDYKGVFRKASDCGKNDFDVVIGTSFLAAYKLNDYNAYKMYFVQDYEPYFFKVNERYFLAKLTYELGFHIVSLGQWNINQINRECRQTPSKLDYIDFPYEKSEYQSIHRNYREYSQKKTLTVAAYIKEEGKRIPNIIQYILLNASRQLEKDGIHLDVNFFGLKDSYRPMVGKNLGKLNKSELNSLYQRSDFGLVASMTNISLVPYEMLATGLPVIEMKYGSFPDFFDDQCALLIDFNYMTLVKQISNAIKYPDMLESMVKAAECQMNDLSWKNSCRQFAEIMESGTRNYGK